jgi:CRP-like cAMP-binding protein
MSMDAGTADIIKGIEGLSQLDDDGIAALASTSSLSSVPEGTTFFQADDPSWDVYFVISGIVGISMSGPGAREPLPAGDTELLVLRSGAFFGELSFLDGARRHLTVTARERTLVLRLNGPLLKARCEADALVGRAVYSLLGKSAARTARDISMELRNIMAARS